MKRISLKKSKNQIPLYEGFSFPDRIETFQPQRVFICIVKALIVFCASLGTIGSVVSAFELSVNMPLIFVLLFLMSTILSFLHYNNYIFNLCYPIVFFLFAFTIIRNRVYVNSGYQAMGNIIREAYRDYFELNFSRQTSEAIADRYQTMTLTLLFLGFFLVVLLNIVISTYMSIFFTILMTFPFLQFGLYIGKIPSFFYIFLLLFSYISVTFMKRSEHFTLSENTKKSPVFHTTSQTQSYKGHGKTLVQLLMASLVVTVIFAIPTYPIMKSNILAAHTTSKLKASTDQIIQRLIQGGIYSFWNRYDATGGISDGLLGGVSSVQADYETDLEVTFVPIDTSAIYLKAYTGVNYSSRQWTEADYDENVLKYNIGNAKYEDYNHYTAFCEANHANTEGANKAKLSIKTVDPEVTHALMPYFTSPENNSQSYTLSHSIARSDCDPMAEYSVDYYPYTQRKLLDCYDQYDTIQTDSQLSETEKEFQDYYDMYCNLYYKTVPAQASLAIQETMKKIGTASNVKEQLSLIQNYLYANYDYTLSPGTTPWDQDFVSYFLGRQKKGYCSHFASATTLLCRGYGIPARYVEGYVIQLSDIADATVNENAKIEDWTYGNFDSSLDKTGVVTVSVLDANAHAWTEIYVNGFGWVPIDFTPPSSEEDKEEEYSLFQSLFSGLFTTSKTVHYDTNEAKTSKEQSTDFFTDNQFLFLPLLFFVSGSLFIYVMWRMIKKLLYLRHIYKMYQMGHYDQVLPHYYVKLKKQLQKKKYTLPASPLAKELFDIFINQLPDLSEETKKATAIFQAGLYSPLSISRSEMDFFIKYTVNVRKKLKKKH